MTNASDDTVLWRYMDLAKFVSILSTRMLYFPSALSFADPFEGTVNQTSHEAAKLRLETKISAAGKKGLGKFLRLRHEDQWVELPLVADDVALGLSQGLQNIRARTYVSCWHQNEHESEAMWRLYVPDMTSGIALRTTVGRLKAALPQNLKPVPVSYMDYAGKTELEYFSQPFVTKRIAFEHEREWRVVTKLLPAPVEREDGVATITLDPGAPSGLSIPLKVSLADLVTEARVSPLAQPWIKAVYEDLLEKYHTPLKVMNSALAMLPFTPA